LRAFSTARDPAYVVTRGNPRSSFGTPRPQDRTTATGRSPGSRVIIWLHLPRYCYPVAIETKLTNHSCGGSAGSWSTPLPASLFILSLGTCRDPCYVVLQYKRQEAKCFLLLLGLCSVLCPVLASQLHWPIFVLIMSPINTQASLAQLAPMDAAAHRPCRSGRR
jgi:hypothetical protein